MFNQIPYGIGNQLLTTNAYKSTFLSKINWSTLLSNTQKTLNVVNQAIPLYYQVKPIFGNIKTLGRISKEFGNLNNSDINKIDTSNKNSSIDNKDTNNNISYPNPTFFL